MNRKIFIVIQVVLLALLGSVVGTAAGRLSSPSKPAQQPMGLSASPLTPVGSGFTYQGRLLDGGSPANGQYDFQIIMYDALVGGNQVGPVVTATNQLVSDGLITLTLDFGAGVYDGNGRWLEVQLRQAGGGSYTILSPRQPLTPAPYAMHAKEAETVPDGSITTSKIADGAVTSAKIAGGLVSSNISLQQTTANLGYFITSSTTFVDIPDSAITTTVATSATLLVNFTGSVWTLLQPNFAAEVVLTINVDGVDRIDLVNQDAFGWSGSCCAPNPVIAPAGFMSVVPVGPGTHTVKLRILSLSYDQNYRYAGIGYNGRSSTFSVMVFGQ